MRVLCPAHAAAQGGTTMFKNFGTRLQRDVQVNTAATRSPASLAHMIQRCGCCASHLCAAYRMCNVTCTIFPPDTGCIAKGATQSAKCGHQGAQTARLFVPTHARAVPSLWTARCMQGAAG